MHLPPPLLSCATITTISAFVSLGFSLAAVRSHAGDARAMALHAAARSVALAAASVVAFLLVSLAWMEAVACCMIVVQALDALIELRLGNAMKAIVPALVAALNLWALLWLMN